MYLVPLAIMFFIIATHRRKGWPSPLAIGLAIYLMAVMFGGVPWLFDPETWSGWGLPT